MSAWVDQMFRAQQSMSGGVVRRSIDDVMQYGALDEIIARAQENGWHVIETGDQIVVLCHPGSMQIFC
ncbi:N-(5'-phosphoribosyl)anthranilate isomerase [Microbacterium sp. MYb64]|uniref:N-(5'-phosphoribosyl)anthranilate isomerase n=1 Tax=Microbacterium sp. MYb64 TaxID=1848691 RepID=UPI000CFD161B|nr:N-(5'-phosphoribosyl)anthranilate isomerase [Microbacterium sp. MYb64]PRB01754.1 N-(5'-phosphoribosyl)anthranilate isomerase [Microbacterium sp. MYb64]